MDMDIRVREKQMANEAGPGPCQNFHGNLYSKRRGHKYRGAEWSMKENKYIVAGYSFPEAYDYKEAKREEETVQYIKANTDLNDLTKVIKLYQKLTARKMLKTVVGFEFLKELQNRIRKEEIVSEDNIPPIPVERREKEIKVYSGELDHEQEKRHMAVLAEYKGKLRNTWIICGFLAAIIIAMLFISAFSDRGVFADYESQILDKYSAWEEDLNAKELQLDSMESQLKAKESQLDSLKEQLDAREADLNKNP